MSEKTENYRNHAIEAARMLLGAPDEWSFNVVALANELVAALEANRPNALAVPVIRPAPEKRPYKPIIAIDVDGPLHAYLAWSGATVLDGGPVPGAMQAIHDYTAAGYEVHIVSSRLNQPGGLEATQKAISGWLADVFGEERATQILRNVEFTVHKPPASLTIDDRAFQFRGVWPTVAEIRMFMPWRSYDVPDTETKDMNRSIMVLIFGMVAALASTALRSDKVAEARVAVEEIQAILKQNNEEFLSDIFRKILKFE
jgi:hypothetical protein